MHVPADSQRANQPLLPLVSNKTQSLEWYFRNLTLGNRRKKLNKTLIQKQTDDAVLKIMARFNPNARYI